MFCQNFRENGPRQRRFSRTILTAIKSILPEVLVEILIVLRYQITLNNWFSIACNCAVISSASSSSPPEPKTCLVFRSLVCSFLTEKGYLESHARIKALATLPPAPPAKGLLWHSTQELASGPKVRVKRSLGKSLSV